MIRLTLSDGTRVQLPVSEIDAVEPSPSGAIVIKTSGETLEVLQGFRTVEARVAAAMVLEARDSGLLAAESSKDAQAPDTLQRDVHVVDRPPESPSHRRKRVLLGRVSMSAFMFGQVFRKGPATRAA